MAHYGRGRQGSYERGLGGEMSGRDFGEGYGSENMGRGGRFQGSRQNQYGGFRGQTGWGEGGYQRGYDVGYGGYGYGTGFGGYRGTGQQYGANQGGFGGYEGGRNTGYGNAGYGDTGYGNVGYGNTGYGNAGFDTSRDMGYGGESTGMRNRGGEMSRMRASELMTENPEAVTPDTTLADVAKKMKDLDVGIIPVVDSMEGRRLKGVVTDRDIAIRAIAEGKDGKAKVNDIMTSDLETVNKNDRVRDVLNLMEREQVRRVPVTDREGRLVGIIAQADLAVDYAEDRPRRERMVESAVERISEPARPERGMQAGGRTENR